MTIALLLVTGLIALYFGAEWLVRGGAGLAVRLGVTPLMVGLTVVAYGTSTPELVVSSIAASDGNGAIAIGNAVGSNIFNICFILGLTALVCPMRVQFQLVKIDTPFMIGVALLFLVFFRDLRIAVWESVVFLAGIIFYSILNVRMARRITASADVAQEFKEEMPKPVGRLSGQILLIAGGLILLVIGSRLFVDGAVQWAKLLGVSDAIIGLTIVAAGTSLPELASSLTAAFRKHPDIAVGNVVGSNIYNILAILGLSGLLGGGLAGQGVSLVDAWAMIGVSLLLLVLAWTGFQLRRWEGALLLAIYGGYLCYLWPES